MVCSVNVTDVAELFVNVILQYFPWGLNVYVFVPGFINGIVSVDTIVPDASFEERIETVVNELEPDKSRSNEPDV
jgi:hypothetical protein